MSILGRLSISAGAGISAGVITALAVTVVDLYLTGHGYASITEEIITWAQGGVHMSLGDLAMLLVAIAAASLAWKLSRHDP